jgi:hypothetical protein
MSKKVVPLARAAKSSAPDGGAASGRLSRAATARDRRSPPHTAAELGPGLHLARVERILAGACAVRTLSGERLSAAIDEDVEPSLVAECLRNGRKVIVCVTAEGPTVMGALQTAPAITRAEDGKLSLEAKELRLRAERSLVIEAGPAALRVDGKGVLRLEGDRMSLDLGPLVRFLSGRVELP